MSALGWAGYRRAVELRAEVRYQSLLRTLADAACAKLVAGGPFAKEYSTFAVELCSYKVIKALEREPFLSGPSRTARSCYVIALASLRP